MSISKTRFNHVHSEVREAFPSLCHDGKPKELIIINLLKFLYPLSQESHNFSELYIESGIRMKRSFLNYVDLALELELVTKQKIAIQEVEYKITDKGRILLGIFHRGSK